MTNIDFNKTVQVESKSLQLKLAKNELNYASDEIQFFIPVIITKECLEWLNIIAERNLQGENQKIVKEFLAFVLQLRDTNSKILHETLLNKMIEITLEGEKNNKHGGGD